MIVKENELTHTQFLFFIFIQTAILNVKNLTDPCINISNFVAGMSPADTLYFNRGKQAIYYGDTPADQTLSHSLYVHRPTQYGLVSQCIKINKTSDFRTHRCQCMAYFCSLSTDLTWEHSSEFQSTWGNRKNSDLSISSLLPHLHKLLFVHWQKAL